MAVFYSESAPVIGEILNVDYNQIARKLTLPASLGGVVSV